MTPGTQAVQSSHSLVQFVFEYQEISQIWFKDPYLVQLSIENEEELTKLILKLEKNQIKHSIFREPDLNNEITAIAIEPSDKVRRLLSNLPLMLKEYKSYKNKEVNYV